MILIAGDFHDSGTMTAWTMLREGRSALEALEPAVRLVEANPEELTVGQGGYPNAIGEVELDAGVMDGRTRASGAVGALKGFAHPVSVAYQVMTRLPHVLLVGEGAVRFAAEIGAERAELLTDAMRAKWHEWRKQFDVDPDKNLVEAVYSGADPKRSGGTTVYLAQDVNGDIAAVTSTSGWAWKYPGRLGDTPIAGAGFYADNRYGAAACTGMGEIAIRSSLARMTVAYMQTGRSVAEAVQEAVADIGYHDDQSSGITVYAIDAQGGHFVGHVYGLQGGTIVVPYYYLGADGDAHTSRRNSTDLSAYVRKLER